MSGWRLVGDVGGSNARFARASGNTLSARRSYSVCDHPTFYHALARYLEDTGGVEGYMSAAIGVAGPVDAGRCKLTNAAWTIDAEDTAKALGGVPTAVVNDLQAVALALPTLADTDLIVLGNAARAIGTQRTMLALNVGTGFGAASAVPWRDGWVTCGSEPGHMVLGSLDADEMSIVQDATVEDLLSGRGVKALYGRVAARHGAMPVAEWSGADIFRNARADAVAADTVRHFSRLLGRVAGDLVLASGAWGGVYLCGSVVDGWAEVADMRDFRAPFERKGAMSERMRDVFSGVVTPDDAPLVGLSSLGIDTP